MQIQEADTKDLVAKVSPLTRMVLRLFRRRLNSEVFCPLLSRSCERGVITSAQLHSLHHHFDPTQQGVIGRL